MSYRFVKSSATQSFGRDYGHRMIEYIVAQLKRSTRLRLGAMCGWKIFSKTWPMPGTLLLFGCGKLLQHPRWLNDYLTNLLMVGSLLGGLRIVYYCCRRLRLTKHHIVTLVVFESPWFVSLALVMYGLRRLQRCCSDGHETQLWYQFDIVNLLMIASVLFSSELLLKYIRGGTPSGLQNLDNESYFNAVTQPPGLKNLGNTCYFNAVMQNVYQTPLLKDLREIDGVLCPKAPISRALLNFYERMSDPKDRSFFRSGYDPSSLFNALCQRSTRFRGGRQQDSHEVLRHLMDGIREELKQLQQQQESDASADDTSPLTVVDSIFGGHFVTIFHCKTCQMPYHLFEPFLDISLPIAFEEEERKDAEKVRLLNQSNVVATEHKGAKIPEASDEPASEQSVINVDETLWKRRSESETVTEEANKFVTGCDVDGKTSEDKQEADDNVDDGGNEIRDHEKKAVEHHVEENADIIPGSSETEDRGNIEQEYDNIVSIEQTYEHVNVDDIQPTTVDATAPEIHSGLDGDQKAVDLQPLDDAADSKAATEQLPASDEEHDLEDDEARHIQTHDQKDDTGIQDSFRHSEKDYEGTETSCSGVKAGVDAKELAEESSKPQAAETETERLLKFEEEPSELRKKEQSCGVGDSEVEISDDDSKVENRTTENEEDRIVKVQSSPRYAEYVAAVNKIKERLNTTTQKPEDNSVTNCLRFYTREEQLDEYFCLTCNQGSVDITLQMGTKQTLIFNPPAVLTLHLKRFEQTSRGYVKVTRHIAFDKYLDLSPYCTRFAWGQQPVNSGEESFRYRLYGVVVHGGSLEGGHYTACVRVRTVDLDTARTFLQKKFLDRQQMMTKEQLIKLVAEGVPRERLPYSEHQEHRNNEDQWFEISDTSVSETDFNRVKRKEAYLLFYERVS